MNANHVYAQKAARAIADANAESNRPRPRRRTRERYERPVLSAQSSWCVETGEYMGDGFSVTSQDRSRTDGSRSTSGLPSFSEVRTFNVLDICPDGRYVR